MPDEAAPAADISAPESEGTWSIATALAETDFGREYSKLATADTPAAPDDKPTSDEGLAKPVATAEEPKADADATAEETPDRLFTKDEVESRRATAQRERDTARKEAETARADATAKAEALAENEFQRGVQLRTIQLLEQLTMQKGATDLQDLRAAQIQAFNEMKAAREQITETDIRRAQSEAEQEKRSAKDIEAANAKAQSLFDRQALTLQKSAGAKGVPTFDAETALQTAILSKEAQEEVVDINALPADKQEAAALRFYARWGKVVEAQMDTLAAVKAPKHVPAPAPDPQTLDISDSPRAAGFDLKGALESTFDPDRYLAIVNGNPHLQGR